MHTKYVAMPRCHIIYGCFPCNPFSAPPVAAQQNDMAVQLLLFPCVIPIDLVEGCCGALKARWKVSMPAAVGPGADHCLSPAAYMLPGTWLIRHATACCWHLDLLVNEACAWWRHMLSFDKHVLTSTLCTSHAMACNEASIGRLPSFFWPQDRFSV